MKIVKDLLVTCDRQRLFEEFIKLHSDFPKEKKDEIFAKFNALIDSLKDKTEMIVGADDIVCSEPTYEDGKIRYGSVAVSADDVRKFFRPLDFFDELDSLAPEDITDDMVEPLLAKCQEISDKSVEYLGDKTSGSYPGYIERYGYMLGSRDDIICYIVPSHIIGTDEQYQLLASVIFEMTFFGFDEKQAEQERKKLKESLVEMEQLDSLPPEEQAKHFHSTEELEEELGITDDRTNEEKARDEFTGRKEMLVTFLLRYREMKKLYADFTCEMKYFITERERDGTWYHEWAKGKHSGETFWNDDSILLSVETMRDIGLYKFLYDVIPNYDKYEDAVIDKELWERIKECSKEYSTQIQECIAVAESWVQETFKQYDVFTIIGQ